MRPGAGTGFDIVPSLYRAPVKGPQRAILHRIFKLPLRHFLMTHASLLNHNSGGHGLED